MIRHVAAAAMRRLATPGGSGVRAFAGHDARWRAAFSSEGEGQDGQKRKHEAAHEVGIACVRAAAQGQKGSRRCSRAFGVFQGKSRRRAVQAFANCVRSFGPAKSPSSGRPNSREHAKLRRHE